MTTLPRILFARDRPLEVLPGCWFGVLTLENTNYFHCPMTHGTKPWIHLLKRILEVHTQLCERPCSAKCHVLVETASIFLCLITDGTRSTCCQNNVTLICEFFDRVPQEIVPVLCMTCPKSRLRGVLGALTALHLWLLARGQKVKVWASRARKKPTGDLFQGHHH